MDSATIGILTASDRAAAGVYEDLSGRAIEDYLRAVVTSPFTTAYRLVTDDRGVIEDALRALCDETRCDLVLTTGGTGPAPRDVTPDATLAVVDRVYPGFGEAMRATSRAFVPTAILSRQLAGSRGATLIINLPGKPRAIAECLDAVMAAVPYCIDLLGGPRLTTDPARIVAFRPGIT